MTRDELLDFLARAEAANEQALYEDVIRERGYVPGMVPYTPPEAEGYGVVGSAWEALKRGGQQIVEDIPGGISDIPAGIAQTFNVPSAAEYETMTPWERFQSMVGQAAGTAQAVAGPFRTLFSPVAGAARAITEYPHLLTEEPGVPRTPEMEEARRVGQMGVETALLAGVPKLASSVLNTLRSRGITPPVAEPPIDTSIRIGGRRVLPVEPLPRPLALPEPSPGRVFAGQPSGAGYRPGATWGQPDIVTEPLIGKGGRVIQGVEKVTQPVPRTQVPYEPPVGPEARLVQEAAPFQRAEETIGQTIRRLRRERQPELGDDVPLLQGTMRAGEGKPAGMPLRDWVKLNQRGAGEKLETAVKAGPDARVSAPPHIQAAADAVSPTPFSDFISSHIPWGSKFAWWLRKANSPEFIVRNDPAAKEIVDTLIGSERLFESRAADYIRKLVDIRDEFGGGNRNLGNAEIKRIFGMRDRGIVPTNPSDAQKLRRIEPLSNEAGASIGITTDHPGFVKNYVHRARQNVIAERTRLIQVPGGYIPHDVKRLIPSEMRPSFSKSRKIDVPGERYDMEYLSNWLRSVARASVYGTPQKHGVLQDLGPMLNRLSKSDPNMQEYVARLINYVIGAPGTRSSIEATRTGNVVRNLEYIRTIGINPMSPLNNTYQRVPTLVETGPVAWVKGLKDEIAYYRKDPAMLEIVKKAKVEPEAFSASKVGLDELAALENKLERGIVSVRELVGKGFAFSERGNRLHALFAGRQQGLAQGMSEAEAIDRGVKVMEKTQFPLGRVGRQEIFRKEPLATWGQYKSFPIKSFEYAYRNMEDVVKGIRTAVRTGDATQLRDAGKKFITLWGAQYAIAGPMAIPLFGESISKITDKQWQGILPHMGMAVTELMGLGMFDFSDFQTLSFWMPGPAFNHLYEIAKGAQGLAGVDLPKLGPLGGAAPTPGQTARYLTRSVSVPLERVRRGLIMSPTGEEREPRTLKQAFGIETIPQTQPLIRTDPGALPRQRRALGIVPPSRELESEAFEKEEQARMIRDRAIRSAQQAGDAGDFEERERILNRANDQLESLLGRRGYLKLTPQSRRAAREAAESPVLKRMREAAGKQLGTFRNPSDTIE